MQQVPLQWQAVKIPLHRQLIRMLSKAVRMPSPLLVQRKVMPNEPRQILKLLLMFIALLIV